MERFTSSIRESLEAKNWHAALFMALTMPDICGNIAYPNLKHAGEKYRSWFQDHLHETYTDYLTAAECWALRCSMLHAGKDKVSKNKGILEALDRIYFTPNPPHKARINNTLTLNIQSFCEDICSAVDAWYKSVQTDAHAMKQIESLTKVMVNSFRPVPEVLVTY